ncbi:hypothetical protein CDN99_10705 [Roseateles aquatilis]|uniref:Polymerase nucleotidyl transferase domain-containing protein n=1 Tax=Roseateles aquatilis TaxID=431061 RepID=A0A246JDI2_9BURK|nr:nucleotidyltransferase domain-containing protein [Roseateles aquatilis]OWQ90659.1 hypothetical protein CDN99_10705 [Roseateles aquatilis]
MTTPDGRAIEQRVADARDWVRPFVESAGVIGAFLHGSSTRPYGDDDSDADLCVVVEPEAPRMDPEFAFQRLWKDGRKVADLKFVSIAELGAPQVDLEHYRAVHARILFDRDGQLASLLARVAKVPHVMATDRLKVHYFEVTFVIGKIQSALRRHQREAVTLLRTQLVLAAARLLFLQRGTWPPPTTWIFHELALVGVPSDLIAALRDVLDVADPRRLRVLRGALDGHLIERGATFVDNPVLLLDWLFESPEGRRAQMNWRSAW